MVQLCSIIAHEQYDGHIHQKKKLLKISHFVGQKKAVLCHSVKVEVFSEFAIDKKL